MGRSYAANLVLPASIRKGSNPRTLATCIDTTAGSTVTVFLPLKSSITTVLKGSSSYVKASLTLACELILLAPRQLYLSREPRM